MIAIKKKGSAKMRKILTMIALIPLVALADTETVDGIEWTYSVINGEATVGSDKYLTRAISPNTLGAITIPSTLGGCPVTRIGVLAFARCSGLTSLNIPSGVTSIGGSAFSGCDGLTLVTMPSSVTSIEGVAFYGCSGLKNVTVSECVCGSRLSSVFPSAFSTIEEVTVADGVTSIGERAFNGCSSLMSVTLPSSVTNIGDWAFCGCSELASVTIPSGVKSIGEGAFWECSGLTSVTIPPGVTSIGEDTFGGCSNLTSVTIPQGVTNVGFGAFCECNGLMSVTIPSSVTSIGDMAFYGCSGLESVTIPECVCNDRFLWTFSSAYKTITEVIIADGVTSVGDYAFSGCNGLTSVTVPPSVTSIGYHAFDGTPFFDNLPDGMVVLGGGILYRFKGECPAFVTTPLGVTSIADRAFSGCDGLASVTISEGVISVGNEAFSQCSGLTAVTIPLSVTKIGTDAFRGCDSIQIVFIPMDNPPDWLRECFGELVMYQKIGDPISYEWLFEDHGDSSTIVGVQPAYGDIVIPNNHNGLPVTSIGGDAFNDCKGLTLVTIPKGVTSIGYRAFCNCSGLRAVAIPSGVTSIGFAAFNDCSELKSVAIPSSVTRIEHSAFGGCCALETLTIPDNVTSIGGGAFNSCGKLTVAPGNSHYTMANGLLCNKSKTTVVSCPGTSTSVTIPSGVTSIGDRAFIDCKTLRSVTIPSTVKSLGYAAFSHCSGLSSITIPSSVTWIGDSAFDGCGGLISVEIPASVTWIGEGNFSGYGKLAAINVSAANTCYCSIDGILYNKTRTELIRCPGRKSGAVSIPSGVTNIRWKAFCDCSDVTSVKIPEGVANIGEHMFGWCFGLKSVTIPSTVKSIESCAFYNCFNLRSVTMLQGVANVEKFAFAHCYELESVVIPSSVKKIEENAFEDCSSRMTVYVSGDWDVGRVRQMFVESGFNVDEVSFAYAMKSGTDVYDGYIVDEGSNLVGVVEVNAARQSVKATKGWATEVTLVTNITATSATVTTVNGKKWSYTQGEESELLCSTEGCPVPEFWVVLNGGGLEGDWGGNAIVGTRNGKDDKDDPMAEVLERCKGKWSVTIERDEGVASTLRLQLDVQANGAVQVAGNWESGDAVSVSAQMVVLDAVAYVPVILTATKTTSALTALMKIEEGAVALVSAKDPAHPKTASCRLVAGGRTTPAIAIGGYLAEDPVAAGAGYFGRVVINELAYPAKFAQKGLPAGLKINAATGVISGKPSKPGVYDVTFTATSAANSKSNDTYMAVIHVGNYAAPDIAVADSYGPYTPGVSRKVEIPGANGCTVSGLPSGLKWTAREIREKNGSLTAASNSVYGIPTKPGNYTVYFKKKIAEVNDKGKTVKVEHVSTSTFVVSDYPTIAICPVLASDGVVTDIPVTEGTNLAFVVGVAQSISLNLEGVLDGVATTVTAKGLPSGLKLVKTAVYVDPQAKKKVVDHYEYAIEGAPTAVSKVSSKTKAVTPSHVTLSASNKYKWNGGLTFDVTVVALPSWAVGNFSGPVAAADGAYHGTATLTVGKTGKISGKISTQGTNWTYSAKSFAGWTVSGATNFTVEAVAKSGKRERQFVLTLADLVRDEPIPGIFEATATGAFGGDGADLRRIVWKDAGGKALALEYAGAYTYVDAEGAVYSLAVAESGTAKFAGYVNGKKTTLSTSLLTDLAEDGGLVVCAAFYKAPAKSGKTMSPEFYRFIGIQNWHSELIADGVATRDPGAFLSVDETWSGTGKVAASPKYGQTDMGKTVTLTATPDSKSLFVKWVVADANGNVVPGDPYAKKFKYVVGEEDIFASAAFVAKADEPAEPTVLNADAIRAAFAECVVGRTVDVALEVPDEARPVTFSAKNLPSGLKLDTATGRITGTPKTTGTKEVEITLKTQRGTKPSAKFTFASIVN